MENTPGFPSQTPPLPQIPPPPIPEWARAGRQKPSREQSVEKGGRKYSPQLSLETRQSAQAAKQLCEKTLAEISRKLQEIQRIPVWKELEGLTSEELTKRIEDLRIEIGALKTQLSNAKLQLESSSAALKKDFASLSRKYAQMEAEVHALEEQLKVYTDFQGSDTAAEALQMAQETQSACQELSSLSRHNLTDLANVHEGNNFTKIDTSIRKLKKQKADIKQKLDAVRKASGKTPQDTLTEQILSDALELLQGTVSQVAKRVQDHHEIHFHARNRKIVSQRMDSFNRDLSALSDGKSHSTLRLTFLGRLIHQREIETLEGSLKVLEQKTSDLVEKVATGKVSEAELSLLRILQKQLAAVEKRYKSLQVTLGKAASEEQFRERAICQTSIDALNARINGLEEVIVKKKLLVEGTEFVTRQLHTALNSKGKQRAIAFWEACAKLNDLTEQIEKQPAQSPFAQNLLQNKIQQLRDQLQAASGTIFDVRSDEELTERNLAMQFASGMGIRSEGNEKAIIFLIKAMTQLSMFSPHFQEKDKEKSEALRTAELQKAQELRAMVDLCLDRLSELSEEEKSSLPQLPPGLLEMYKTSAPAEGAQEWTAQIKSARQMISSYATLLWAEHPGAAECNALAKCERDLQTAATSMNPVILKIAQQAIGELKQEFPITFTPEEEQCIKQLPISPSLQDKRIVKATLAKLMYQALYSTKLSVQQDARKKAIALLEQMGFSVEYQSVFEEIRDTQLILDFQKTIRNALPRVFVEPTPGEDRVSIAQQSAYNIFLHEPPCLWAQTLLTADVLIEGLTESEKAEVQEYVQLLKDHAFLLRNQDVLTRKKDACSWDHAVRLKRAFDHCDTAPSLHDEPLLRDYRAGINAYMDKCHITDDKKRIAQGILDSTGNKKTSDAEYYQTRLGVEGSLIKKGSVKQKDQDLQIDRLFRVVGPILLEALQAEDPTTVLTQYQFNTLLQALALKAEGFVDPSFKALAIKVFNKMSAVQKILSEMKQTALQMKDKAQNPQEYFPLLKHYNDLAKELNTLAQSHFGGILGLEQLRSDIVTQTTKEPDKISEEAQSTFRDSPRMLSCIENGKKFVQDQLLQLEGLPQEEQKKILLHDDFRKRLLEIFANELGTDIPPGIVRHLLTEILNNKKELEKAQRLYLELTEQFDQVKFDTYKKLTKKLMLFSLLPFAGSRLEGSSSDFSEVSGDDLFNPGNQADHAEQMAKRQDRTPPTQLLAALRSFRSEIAPVREILELMEIRPVKEKPKEQLDKDMRSEFAGILATVVSRLEDIETVINDLEKNPTLDPEKRKKAISELQTAKQKLEAYKIKILDRISSEQRQALEATKNDKTQWAQILAKDTLLTPEVMATLINDPALIEITSCFLAATEAILGDEVSAQKINGLVTSFTASIALIVKESVKKCSEPDLRGPMLTSKKALDSKAHEVTKFVPPPQKRD